MGRSSWAARRSTSTRLLKNAAQIKGWGQALTPGADLLIYGCDVAEYADGKALIDALGRLTGADVAASENLTGAADKGGDWNLEYHTGQIAAQLAISAQEQASWENTLAATALGSETKANTTISGTQEGNTEMPPHTVAMDQSGNYVVVWDGNGTGDADGIYAQRFNAQGVAQGSEFRVNTTTTNAQNDPAVAMDANGNFVIAWTDNSGAHRASMLSSTTPPASRRAAISASTAPRRTTPPTLCSR